MKKPLVFVAAACACALALHADFTTYTDVFKAIGTGASGTNNLNSLNGSWSSFAGDVGEISWESGSLVFDLEDNQSIAFSVTDGVAPDTNTVVKVEVKGVFSPVNTNDFPTAAEMNNTPRSAQLGFVIGINTDETPSTTNYYAWAGGNSWVLLSHPAGAEPNVTDETDFIATFNYMTNGTHVVKFDIVRNSNTYPLNGGVALPLTSDAGQAAGNVAGISCYGSGKLKSADGSVGLGVAKLSNDVKYGSLADAVAAVGTSATTVTVVRATSSTDSANIPEGSNITISDPGQLASASQITVPNGTTVKVDTTKTQFDPATNGVYAIPLKISGGTVVVELPTDVAEYKEVASNNVLSSEIEVAIHTKSSIVLGTNPDGSKALSANETKLREFLNTYVNEAYAAAQATSETLATALQASGGNGLPLYQSYALGIAPTDSVKPVAVPKDMSSDKITLYIPALTNAVPSGDYEITYKVGNEEVGGPGAVTIPLPEAGAGSSTAVKIQFD